MPTLVKKQTLIQDCLLPEKIHKKRGPPLAAPLVYVQESLSTGLWFDRPIPPENLFTDSQAIYKIKIAILFPYKRETRRPDKSINAFLEFIERSMLYA